MAEAAQLRFHVPEPEVRPGGQPDFSNVVIPEAGSVERPPVDADPEFHSPAGLLNHPRAELKRRGRRSMGRFADGGRTG